MKLLMKCKELKKKKERGIEVKWFIKDLMEPMIL